MKIYNKLLLGIGSLAVAFILLLGFTALQMATIFKLQDFFDDTGALLLLWDEVQMRTYDLTETDKELEKLQSEWNTSVAAFEKELDVLVRDPRIKLLSTEVQAIVSDIGSVWSLTMEQIRAADMGLTEYIDKVAGKHDVLLKGSMGLLEGMWTLERERKLETIDGFYFNRFRNFQKSIMLTNSAFKKVLGNLRDGTGVAVAARIRFSVLVVVSLSIFVIVGGLLYIHFLASRLAKRIGVMEGSMRTVAERDFTVRPPVLGKDEIGDLSRHLGTLVDSLGSFFRSVKSAVDNVAMLKDELSDGTARSAAAVNEITQNIDSIKTRFEVLDSAIEQAQKGLSDIGATLSAFNDETSQQTASMSDAGRELSRAVEAVGLVSRDLSERARNADALKRVVIDGGEKVQATNEVIKGIVYDISGIAEFIELIDQISEQTNILSMNAAIESAHAGTAGKGFAVVAEEIRKLAESTQENAQRIGAVLESITSKADAVLQSSESTVRSFESINADMIGFVGALGQIASQAENANREAVKVASAITESIQATKRVSDGTAEMNERHRSIREAMENIKAISDEAVMGITEIDTGSREILGGMVKVGELGTQTKERMNELEASMAGFKIEAAEETEE